MEKKLNVPPLLSSPYKKTFQSGERSLPSSSLSAWLSGLARGQADPCWQSMKSTVQWRHDENDFWNWPSRLGLMWQEEGNCSFRYIMCVWTAHVVLFQQVHRNDKVSHLQSSLFRPPNLLRGRQPPSASWPADRVRWLPSVLVLPDSDGCRRGRWLHRLVPVTLASIRVLEIYRCRNVVNPAFSQADVFIGVSGEPIGEVNKHSRISGEAVELRVLVIRRLTYRQRSCKELLAAFLGSLACLADSESGKPDIYEYSENEG